MSFERILPFLRPIESLIRDPEVSDIMVNGQTGVFIERDGRVEPVPGVIVRENYLRVAVRNIARTLDDDISEEKPILDSRLPDGSRVAAIMPPCSLEGTTLTIRKFHTERYTSPVLVQVGTLTEALLEQLRTAVQERQNILISGGTGTGKTTLLNALATFIAPEDRVLLIEDTSELQLAQANLVRLEARREQPSLPAVGMRDLLKAALRHRPDRILLGEVRGGEAFDLLQALNTGHAGTLSTIHANSARAALSRFTTCVLMSEVELPYRAVRSNIADALNLVIHIERRQGKRYVTEVLRVIRYDPAADAYEFESLYCRE